MTKSEFKMLMLLLVLTLGAFFVTTWFVMELDSKADRLEYRIMKVEGE